MSTCRFSSALGLALTLACGFATTVLAQGRIYAEPELEGANPFLPSEIENVELPVAVGGFSVVELRDHRRWVPGEPKHQLVFDGQIYWFAGRRDRDIFAVAPNDYAPALGGDCIVSYVDKGQRTPGKLELGLVHAGRIYFFAGQSQREQFRAHPSFYARGDLAQDGHCLVSQIDEGKVVAGLPETTAIVNGLRYLFAGAYERRLFASDPSHYGVQRIIYRSGEQQPNPASDPQTSSPGAESKQKQVGTGATRLPGQELGVPEEQHYAMKGYCPVSIQTQGIWVHGRYQNHVDYDGKRYLLAGEKEKKLFQENPEKYEPALGGDCIVSKTDHGKVTPGSVYHSLIFNGKLYLFAGPEEVKAFKADPTRYDQPEAKPTMPKAPLQEEAAPADEQQSAGSVLQEGRRSEFSGSRLSR